MNEPAYRLPAPWHWIRRAGLWVARDHRGTCVRSWSANEPTRLVIMPRQLGTRAVDLAVYVAVAAANDPGMQKTALRKAP